MGTGQRLRMHKFLLRAHGPDLSKEEGMKKALANCFEALLASLYLDADLATSDR